MEPGRAITFPTAPHHHVLHDTRPAGHGGSACSCGHMFHSRISGNAPHLPCAAAHIQAVVDGINPAGACYLTSGSLKAAETLPDGVPGRPGKLLHVENADDILPKFVHHLSIDPQPFGNVPCALPIGSHPQEFTLARG